MIKSEAGKNCEDTGKKLYYDNLFDIGPGQSLFNLISFFLRHHCLAVKVNQLS